MCARTKGYSVRALCYNTSPLVTRKEEVNLGGAVLLLLCCRFNGRDVWGQQICRLDSVDGHRVLSAVPVNGDSLPGPSQDEVGSLVGLRQRTADGIHAYEDVGAGVEVLAHKGPHRGRTRLHWLKVSHDTFEAGGKVLGTAGYRLGCFNQ